MFEKRLKEKPTHVNFRVDEDRKLTTTMIFTLSVLVLLTFGTSFQTPASASSVLTKFSSGHFLNRGFRENRTNIPEKDSIHSVANIAICQSGDDSCNPYYLTFDSSNNMTYVAEDNDFDSSGYIAVINGTSFLTSISVGVYPQFLTYDPHDQRIFAASDSASSVYVISGKTNSVIKTINTNEGGAYFPLYNPANNEVYVTDTKITGEALQHGGAISIINDTTYKVTKLELPCSTESGCEPTFLLFDPLNQNVYASVPVSTGGSYLYEISSTTNTVVASIQLNNGITCGSGSENDGFLVYNPSNKDIIVQCAEGGSDSSGEVLVINPHNVETNIPVGYGPEFLTYDSASGAIYVNSYNYIDSTDTNLVYVINKNLGSAYLEEKNQNGGCCVSGQGGFLAYSPFNKDVFVVASSPLISVVSSGKAPKIVTTLDASSGIDTSSPGFLMFNPSNNDIYATVGSIVSVWS